MRYRLLASLGATVVVIVGCGDPDRDAASDRSPSPPPSPEPAITACEDVEPISSHDGEVPVDGQLDDDPHVAQAQGERARLRLDSDADTTRQVLDELAAEGRDGLDHPVLMEEEEQVNPSEEVRQELERYRENELGETDAGLWIDRDAGGVITIATTQDAAEHEEAVAGLDVVAEHDEAVAVVEAEYSSDELDEAQAEVSELMQAQTGVSEDGRAEPGTITAAGLDTVLNRVSVTMVDDEDGEGTAAAQLADTVDEAGLLCLDTFEPPAPPQPADGVRILAKAEEHGDIDGLSDEIDFAELAVVDDADAGGGLWEQAIGDDLPDGGDVPIEPGLYEGLDTVDWDTETLVLWRSGESGSCPQLLADVAVTDDGRVDVVTDDHAPTGDCTADYNPYRMAAAVDRDRLPDVDDLPAELEGVPDGDAVAWP